MKDIRYGQGKKTILLKAPVDTAATGLASNFVDMKNALWARFFVAFGVITATSADQAVIVTLELATGAASTSAVQLGANYRLSGAVGTDTWGAITAFTGAAGVSIATTDDNKLLAIDVDPHALEAALTHGRYINVIVTPDAGATVTLAAIWVEQDVNYPQNTQLSAS